MKIIAILNNEFDRIKLTNREKEVAILLLKFNSSKEIAKLLFLSEHSVKFHLSSIFKKLSFSLDTRPQRNRLKFFKHFYALLNVDGFMDEKIDGLSEEKIKSILPRSSIK